LQQAPNAIYRLKYVFIEGTKSISDSNSNLVEDLSPLRRAARNFGKLLRGRSVAAVLELLTVVILARSLSPANFGNIVLIQTYVLVVRELFNFKVFEAIIRFGVPMIEANHENSFKQLLRFTLRIDVLSAATATVVAVLAAPLTARILGWDDNLASIAILYSSVLLIFGFGTAKGVLRLFDRFDILSTHLIVGPGLRLIGVLVVMLWDPTVFLFVVVLTLATASGNIYVNVRGWAELRRQVGSSPKGWREAFPGLGNFIAVVYWQANVDMLPKQLSTLLAGLFLGSQGAGLLRLASEITKILSKPGELLQQVLFPDLVRMWNRGATAFVLMLRHALLISAMYGLVFVVASIFGGSLLLGSTFGEDYEQAAPLLSLLMLATTFELLATVLRTAGYAMGHAGKILRLHLIGSVLYLLVFVVLTPYAGLIGPGLAACLAALVPLGGMWLLMRKNFRKSTA